MCKVFEIEDINLDDLLAPAMEDPDLIAGDNAAFRGIKFADLQSAYRQFCTDEPVPKWARPEQATGISRRCICAASARPQSSARKRSAGISGSHSLNIVPRPYGAARIV
jgi:hypothetical protein